ncbi:HTH-type transcriptional regulator PrtR [Halomonadaceae bacterium LMG 33818]
MDTVGKRVRKARKQAGLNQAELAEKIGIRQATISELENSLGSTTHLVSIAKACGVNVDWLATGEGEMLPSMQSPIIAEDVSNEEYAFIPVLSVKAAAGDGYVNVEEVNEGTLAFRREWMQRQGLREKNLRLIRACGESMYPNINEGDMLLVDTSQIEPVTGKVYAIRRPDFSLSVKRLSQGFTGDWTIISDNPDKAKFRDEPVGDISAANIPIVGRVVWRGGLM